MSNRDFRVGQRLANARFELTQLIEKGRFGHIYVALDHISDTIQEVALKILFPDNELRYPYELLSKALRHEFEVLQRAAGPSVVKTFGLVEDQGVLILIEELVRGGDLRHLRLNRQSSQQPLSVIEGLQLAIACSEALEHIHNLGILHADFKPANICLYDPHDFTKVALIDFGQARIAGDEQLQWEEEAEFATLAYLPPENTGYVSRPYTPASDLYALGVSLFELLTGRLPYEGKNTKELTAAILSKIPPALHNLRSDIPEILSDIVAKLLRKSAADRYQTPKGLKADLNKVLTALTNEQPISSFSLGRYDNRRELNYRLPLIGRRKELSRLQDLAEAAAKGSGYGLMIGAPSGGGKTRVVAELLKNYKKQDFVILGGKFSEFEKNVPLNAFYQIINSHLQYLKQFSEEQRRAWGQMLADKLGPYINSLLSRLPEYEEILPKPATEPPPGSFEEESLYFAKGFAILLANLSPLNRPSIIFVDDVQWADLSSLDLLRHLFQQAQSENLSHCALIGTWRADEVDEQHPVSSKFLTAVDPEHILDLGPLVRSECDELVAGLLDETGPEIKKIQDFIFEFTGGLPFPVYEYLKSLLASGAYFCNEQGQWIFSRSKALKAGMHSGVTSLISKRLRNLSPNALALISRASVIGNSVSMESLEFLYDYQTESYTSQLGKETTVSLADSLHAAAEELIQNHLMLREGEQITFFHDKVREAAYHMVDEETRCQWHTKLAILLTKKLNIQGGDSEQATDAEVFEAAFHTLYADPKLVGQEGLGLLWLAACRAQRIFAYTKVAEYLSFVMEQIPANGDLNRLDESHKDFWLAVVELYADALILNEQAIEGIEWYEKLLPQITETFHLASLLGKMAETYQSLYRYDKSFELGLRAVRLLKGFFCTNQLLALFYIAIQFPILLFKIFALRFIKVRNKTIKSRRKEAILQLHLKMFTPTYLSSPLCLIANYLYFMRYYIWCRDSDVRAFAIGYGGAIASAVGFPGLGNYIMDQALPYFERHPHPIYKGILLFGCGYLIDFHEGNMERAAKRLDESIRTLSAVGEYTFRTFSYKGLLILDQLALGSGRSAYGAQKMIEMWQRIHFNPAYLGAMLRYYALSDQHSEVEQWMKYAEDSLNYIQKQGAEPLDAVYAAAAQGEIYLLRGMYQKAIPLLKLASWIALKRSHRVGYSFLAPIYLARAYIESKGFFKAILPLINAWINQLLNVRVVLPQTCLVTGLWFSQLGLDSLAFWFMNKGLNYAKKRGWRANIAEMRMEAGSWLVTRDPERAEQFLIQARAFYERNGYGLFARRCRDMLEKARRHADYFGVFGKADDLSYATETSDSTDTWRRSTLLARNEAYNTASLNKPVSLRQQIESLTLIELIQNLSKLSTKDQVVIEILDACCAVTGSELGILFEKVEDAGITPMATRGVSLQILEQGGYPSQGIDRDFLEEVIAQDIRQPTVRPENFTSPLLVNEGSVMVIPLVSDTENYGYVYLANRKMKGIYDQRTTEVISPIASQAAISLQNIRLLSDIQIKVRLESEIMAARMVQENFLPVPSQAPIPGIDIAYFYQPAAQAGGDWLWYFHRPALNRAYFFIGDVTGHGIPSAMITGVACGAITGLQAQLLQQDLMGESLELALEDEIAMFASALNQTILATGSKAKRSMTMSFMGMDLNTGQVHVLNAGHPLPILIQANRSLPKFLSKSNIFLGLLDKPKWRLSSFQLKAGDRICLYTDGLIENKGLKSKALSVKTLVKLLRFHHQKQNLDDTLKNIVFTAREQWDGNDIEDDVTVLLIEWKKAQSQLNSVA